MFQEEIQKRLDMLEKELVWVSDSQLHLTEDRAKGEADLTLKLENPCILFRKLEEKKLGYFQNKKCADYVLYEQRGDRWSVHIFELKRTVKESNWEDMKKQFMGAMQNALAIAGFLGINMDMRDVYVYSVYRNDKFDCPADPARLRLKTYQRGEKRQKKPDWNQEIADLSFLEKSGFEHRKIRLNIETGIGEYELSKTGGRLLQ